MLEDFKKSSHVQRREIKDITEKIKFRDLNNTISKTIHQTGLKLEHYKKICDFEDSNINPQKEEQRQKILKKERCFGGNVWN